MAPKRSLCPTSYRNLISFIPETGPDCNEKTTITAPEHKSVPEGLGCEVRSFYENVLSKSEHQKETTITTRQVNKTKRIPDSNHKVKGSVVKKNRKTSNTKCDTNSCNIPSPSVPEKSHDGDSVRRRNISAEHDTFSSNGLDSKQRQYFKLLQFAQLGELDNVRDLFSDKKGGLDVNFTDFYGWTPLMCAAKEGHVNVVKFFLNHGANRYLCNSTGDTAKAVARKAGHLSVVSTLESCVEDRGKRSAEEHQDKDPNASFHCDVCRRDFSLGEEASHFTSTIHLFNSGKRSKTPSYFIPNCNRGFQMLLRSGWDAESGLGPEGKGRKYPVKTVLKQDRAGLGGEDVKRKKAKVTHFDKGGAEAVKLRDNHIQTRTISVRKAARNAARSKDRRNKRWEQNLRFEMS